MAAAKPRALTTDAEVSSAVDGLLSSLGLKVEPDESAATFEPETEAPLEGKEAPRTAPSADVEALWGGTAKKRR